MCLACLRAGTATVTPCRTVIALSTAPVCLVLCTFPLTGPSLDLDSRSLCRSSGSRRHGFWYPGELQVGYLLWYELFGEGTCEVTNESQTTVHNMYIMYSIISYYP